MMNISYDGHGRHNGCRDNHDFDRIGADGHRCLAAHTRRRAWDADHGHLAKCGTDRGRDGLRGVLHQHRAECGGAHEQSLPPKRTTQLFQPLIDPA